MKHVSPTECQIFFWFNFIGGCFKKQKMCPDCVAHGFQKDSHQSGVVNQCRCSKISVIGKMPRSNCSVVELPAISFQSSRESDLSHGEWAMKSWTVLWQANPIFVSLLFGSQKISLWTGVHHHMKCLCLFHWWFLGSILAILRTSQPITTQCCSRDTAFRDGKSMDAWQISVIPPDFASNEGSPAVLRTMVRRFWFIPVGVGLSCFKMLDNIRLFKYVETIYKPHDSKLSWNNRISTEALRKSMEGSKE